MTTGVGAQEAVVVVADEERVGRYAGPLRDRDRWSVTVATDGMAALEAIEEAPAVIVLDRQLPGIHADRLLGLIRERQLDTRVVMVTRVEPGTDPERLGFDDWLVEPVDEDDLVTVVDRALRRATYEREVSELYELAARKAEMEIESTPAELATNDEYQRLRERLSATRESVRRAFEQLEDNDVGKLCSELSRRSGVPDDHFPDP